MILFNSGDRDPFNFNTIMGDFPAFGNCIAFSMAVYSVHFTTFIVFYVILYLVNWA